MKISINNFKAIGSLANYELSPMTILSGTNSSGKSSFIQLLLLLKQTLEIGSSQRVLDLNGKFFNVRNYLDIIKDKNRENKLKIKLMFGKPELYKYRDFPELSLYEAFDNYDLHISIDFDEIEKDRKIIVTSFEVTIIPEGASQKNFIKFENKNNVEFGIFTNVAVFISSESLPRNSDIRIKKINYSAFIPSEFEIEVLSPPMELPNGSISKPLKRTTKGVPRLDGIKAILTDFFDNLNYVGPLRQAPKDEYSSYEKNISVGIEGENVAEIFYDLREKKVIFYKIEENNDIVIFNKYEDTFLNAVKYWLCERFKLCLDIYSHKEVESYVIYVKSLSGIVSTIKHVGFGISQVLPIIVEGLRINTKETLILEQPEIHLHPKVQSSLTDFLISLVKQEKNIVIETHSDHLITRLRRRIAEDASNKLDDKVLLTFVEVGKNDILFKNIIINDFGVLELPYPDDFIEKTDVELKAILKAQMRKRLSKQ